MKVFSDESQLALATLSVDQLVRTKGSASATDGQTILWRIAASGVGITLANGNVAIALVNDKSGRKNLLLNPSMDIWQRGTGPFVGSSNTYSADRFYIPANTTANQSTDAAKMAAESVFSLELTRTGGTYANWIQGVELKAAGEAGIFQINSGFVLSFFIWSDAIGTTTIDAIFRDATGSGTNQQSAISAPLTIPVVAGLQKIEVNLSISSAPNPTNISLDIWNYTDVGSAVISQIQLEQGPVATDFEYRPIAEELALCQRYYYRQTDNTGSSALAMSSQFNGSFNFAVFPYPVTMRASPTFNTNDVTGFQIVLNGVSLNPTNVVLSGETNADVASLTFSLATTATWSSFVRLIGGNWVDFDAEL